MEEKIMNKRFDVFYCDDKRDRSIYCQAWENLYRKGWEGNAAVIYDSIFKKNKDKLFRPPFRFAYADYRSTMSDEEITHAIEVLINCGYFKKFDNKTVYFYPEGKEELINAFLNEEESA